MKFLPSQLYYFLRNRPSRMNVLNLLRFLAILGGLVTTYSVLFHYIMAWEGRNFSWVTGFYWTLTVMTTLGFGDITFESDLGRIFSIVVLLSGVVFLLILLPFTFIEFFYAPWMKSQAEAKAPGQLPRNTRGHVILTSLDPVTRALIEKLKQYSYEYVLLVPELDEALKFYDQGYRVVVGELDNPQTYRNVYVQDARLVAATGNDLVNTNVVSTVREVTEQVPVVAAAESTDSVDILELAGANQVLLVGKMIGQALAQRVSSGEHFAHTIGRFEELVIAESTVRNTPLVGKSLGEIRLRQRLGITVLGVWERGVFKHATAETVVAPGNVLVLAGSQAAIDGYNEEHAGVFQSDVPVIIIGGGRVGRATARGMQELGLDFCIIEKSPEPRPHLGFEDKYVLGNAAEREVLERARILEAPAVVLTTHDDDTNIYLTIYCRRLRPDIQIICRATLERNVVTLHRAGADFVLSYASMGANTIMNLLDKSNVLMIAEGLDVFRLRVPDSLAGLSLAEAHLRRQTDCTVVAVRVNGVMEVNPDPYKPLPAGAELVLIGTTAAEQRFLATYERKSK
jgi:voltage-gated potassium channel